MHGIRFKYGLLGLLALALISYVGYRFYPVITKVPSTDIDCSAASASRLAGFRVARVAHAGGGIGGDTYTNSIDALNKNFARGFRYFELDFSLTADGQLVCLHDWERDFVRSFSVSPRGRLTLGEFLSLVNNHSRYQKCTLPSLARWMRAHPEAYIVTDVKDDDNLKALDLIRAALPNAGERVIPQVYQPQELVPAAKKGFRQIIWMLYRYAGSPDDVISSVAEFSLQSVAAPLAITMPRYLASKGLPEELARCGVPTFVHTINSPTEAAAFFSRGVSEVYTDFLAPCGEAAAGC